MNHEDRCFRPILICSRNIDKNLARFPHLFLFGFEGGIIAPKDFAVSQFHAELKGFALGIALVRQVRINLVFGTYNNFAIAFIADVLGVSLGRLARRAKRGNEKDDSKDPRELPEKW